MAAIHAHRRAIAPGLLTIVYDAATTAYMSAAGVPNTSGAYYTGTGYATTGTAMWNAANDLIVGLKNSGLWGRIYLFYLMLGGTTTSHAVNAKAPGSQTLVSTAGIVHNAQGIRFNGTSQVANTQYAISNMPTGQGYALDYYSADNTTIASGDPIEIGGGSSGNLLLLVVKTLTATGKAAGRASNGGASINSDAAVGSSAGLFTMDRTVAGTGMLYRNGAGLVATPVALAAVPTEAANAICLGALSETYGFSNRGCSLACVRGSFTPAEMLTYYNLVQAFQAANFRAV